MPCPDPTGIDLENIVYYKDDTHYFVMTAKKQCLLRLGVLRQVGPRPRQGGTEWWALEVGSRPGRGFPWVWRESVLSAVAFSLPQ